MARWSRQIPAGQVYHGLTSLVDIAPTMLDVANIPVPSDMQGSSLVQQIENPSAHGRQYIFAEKNWHDLDDHSRAVRDNRYKYIRNAFPEKPLPTAADCARSLTFQKMREMRDAGTLSENAMLLFRSPRPVEELYDLQYDPVEFHNLAGDPAYENTLSRLRNRLDHWIEQTNDVPPSKSLPDEFDPETGERIRPSRQ
ncbi:MAG: sulfatase/phosphatase domain-containing protein [bacterium]